MVTFQSLRRRTAIKQRFTNLHIACHNTICYTTICCALKSPPARTHCLHTIYKAEAFDGWISDSFTKRFVKASSGDTQTMYRGKQADKEAHVTHRGISDLCFLITIGCAKV